MPEKFGKWDTIYYHYYQRFRCWIRRGIFDRIEKELQSQSLDIKGITAPALDSTSIKMDTESAS